MGKLDYRKSGVDIDAAEQLVGFLKSAIQKRDENVIGGIGDFAALYQLGSHILVASTDGVGTKLKIAFLTGRHDTVGIDLVAMSVNDILTKGARPIFFLDYFATGKLDTEVAKSVISGINAGCQEAGCSLIGGETAEMPDFYSPGEYDLAGFAVGTVEKEGIIDGSSVKNGDAILGFPSSGIHSNGYSLVRNLFFKQLRMSVDDYLPECGASLGDVLLTPTKIYVREILRLLGKFSKHIHGMAHITGGGFTNISRINPKFEYRIENLPAPHPIFSTMQERGGISNREMFRTFNMGIGFVLITDLPESIIEESSLKPMIIGHCESGDAVQIVPHKITFSNVSS